MQSPVLTSSNTAAPSQPTGLTATMTRSSSILLSWTAPPSNSASITGYKIEFKTDTDQWSVLVANTGIVNSYSVTGLTTGTSYTYRISAINSIGTSIPSDAVSIATKSTITPTALTAVATSPTSIMLSWVAPSQNFGQIVSDYKIERLLGNNNYDTIVSTTGSTATFYTITGLTTGKSYTFVVSAVYGSTSSGQSNTASATPLTTSKAPVNIPSGNSASLSSGIQSIQMPKNQMDVKKKTEDKSATTIQNSETAMEKAAKAANQKAISDAKAKMQKKLAASKNGTSVTPAINPEKQKALQKIKDIQAENDKLNQRLKASSGNHG
jgi:hypothetical protein